MHLQKFFAKQAEPVPCRTSSELVLSADSADYADSNENIGSKI